MVLYYAALDKGELERVSVLEEVGVREGNAHIVIIMEGIQRWVIMGSGSNERWQARL